MHRLQRKQKQAVWYKQKNKTDPPKSGDLVSDSDQSTPCHNLASPTSPPCLSAQLAEDSTSYMSLTPCIPPLTSPMSSLYRGGVVSRCSPPLVVDLPLQPRLFQQTTHCKNVRVILKLLWLSELHLFGVSHDCSAFAILDHQFWKQNVAIRISMSGLYTAIMRV